MAISATEIARLRRMIDEPTQNDYDDAELTVMAEFARVTDSAGLSPSDTDYVDTYDLYYLAAEIWRLKAGAVSAEFDFEAEGGSFQRSQVYKHRLEQSTRYAGMSAFRSTTVRPANEAAE